MSQDAFDEMHGLDFVPRADVYEMDKGWVIKFDIAGIRPQDIKVEAKGTLLRVSGVRRDQFVERGLRHHSMEISYSRFERRLRLPCDVSHASISTDYADGLLVVTIETGS